MLEISKVKVGNKIEYKKDIYEVIKTVFSKMGRQSAVLRAKMKNLKTGNVNEFTFRDADKLKEAELTKENAQFLYRENDNYHFMDLNSYEQFTLEKEVLGETTNFLIEEIQVKILYHNKTPINIELPIKMEFKVTEAPPATKGNTVDGGTKKIKIETGYELDVPLFIKEGDKIKINTQDGAYVERV
ncbi:MAG: elongation factor P [Candidatus Moranbacteria bacterium]|nr:elongation factor P [Candidatus Moranbacteria bacterium]